MEQQGNGNSDDNEDNKGHTMTTMIYPAHATDEYLKITATTSSNALKHFFRAVIASYGEEYLRRPNNADMVRLFRKAEQGGFPRMLGSVDCMHWEWKNSPTAWAGACKDVNVLYSSPIFNDVVEGLATRPYRLWHSAQTGDVMKCCIILYNMIVEDNNNQEGDDFVKDP
ncbi:PREDICTED: uncharacterized protein LOC105969258 [Erythranthe guttata]|uniref:uncharacterized protein LOC105969258 n=1 Tax=Erythranthe guttata TaxID=4155 RepID=UPI00064DEFF4|nr:PREDICTED: uncharacterized protein LOC105969258 [Erythranthe guttata]|eukprot:XP_012849460.1 PREDICTED: uncharacterized protein LOC105969258 [Erythranthe guttata]